MTRDARKKLLLEVCRPKPVISLLPLRGKLVYWSSLN